MADNTPRLGLPYLIASQAQKEVTHNEALNILELLVQPSVISILSTPPASPTTGDLYIIGSSPTGAWTSYAGCITGYLDGTWIFAVPQQGWGVFDKNQGISLIYNGSNWLQNLMIQNKIGFFGTLPVAKTAVTLGNTNGAIGNLTISSVYSQAEVQAFRNATEILADDVRAIKTALSNYGLI